ncbi:MAG: leucine-rich repeat protein [Lachnospiraceae bacterium]|nr:leucine-rich repeat protein [Lachnospiraceae bacterium]
MRKLLGNVKKTIVLGVLACSVMGATTALAADKPAEITVGQTVNGTKYTTIQQAISGVAEGGTVNVPKGNYKEALTITKSVKVIGCEGAVLDGSEMRIDKNHNDDIDMINIKAKKVTVQNLEITGLKVYDIFCQTAVGIRVEAGSEDVNIIGCHIHHMGVNEYAEETRQWAKDEDKSGETYNCHGIIVKSMSDKAIKRVLIRDCKLNDLKLGQSEALVVNGNVNGFEICHNEVVDCDNIGIDVIGFEENKSYQATNGNVHHNYVSNICSDPNSNHFNLAYTDACAGGIYVDGGKTVTITQNTVVGCDIGIEISSENQGKVTSGITVTHNTLINNNRLGGISIGGCDPEENGKAESCEIAYNTVYNGGSSSACLIIQYANSDTNSIHNNIFYAKKGSVAENEYGYTKNDVQSNITGGDAGKYKNLDSANSAKSYAIQNATVSADGDAVTISYKKAPAEGEFGVTRDEEPIGVTAPSTTDPEEPEDPGPQDTDPVYTWSDDGKSCKAECIKNGETVKEDAKITSKVTKEPTYDSMGQTTYTATFTNSCFSTRTKTVTDVPKLERPVVQDTDPVYTWSDDGKSCKAECIKNGETVKEDAKITSKVTKEPTYDSMGQTTYTATFTNSCFSTRTKTVTDITKLEKKEEPGKEEPGKEEPGKEEPGKEEPGKEEPGKEEPGKEEPKKDEPVIEEPENEDAILIDDVLYEIRDNGDLYYYAPVYKDDDEYQVPSAVTVDGKLKKVKGISKAAFAGCNKAKKVSIGKNVKYIEKNAFKGCKKLKKVVINSKSLKKVGSGAFKKLAKGAKIALPESKKKAYKKLFTKSVIGNTRLTWVD